MSNTKNIKRMFAVINHNVATINGAMDFVRVSLCIRRLVELIEKRGDVAEFEDFELWDIGEHGEFTLDALLVGAYWFYMEYSGGQYSDTYLTQCFIGRIFKTGYTDGVEAGSGESTAYELLETLYNESKSKG